jgi:hypothetical protein
MRTLVSSFLVGVCLVAGPALAQQHPLVPSSVDTEGCMYIGSLPNGRACIRSGDALWLGSAGQNQLGSAGLNHKAAERKSRDR